MILKLIKFIPKPSLRIVPMFKEKITVTFNPADSNIIYQAQSILTRNGKIGPILPLEQAADVVKWASKGYTK